MPCINKGLQLSVVKLPGEFRESRTKRVGVLKRFYQGRSHDFAKGGGEVGGHTVSNNIVMAFPPRNIVGCLLKKGLQRVCVYVCVCVCRGGGGVPTTTTRSQFCSLV